MTLAMLALSSCGGESPSAAVEEFINVTVNQDCQGMVDLLAEESVKALGSTREEAVKNCQAQLAATTGGELKTEVASFEIIQEDIDGDTATVSFKMSVRIVGQEEEIPREDFLKLSRADGTWKIVLD